jgi:hypothetical protein
MLSQHARIRCAQRGITPDFLAAILEHADIQRPAGSNCRLERVSRKRARALNLDDRLSRFAVILSDSSAEIVTVMPLHCQGRMARRFA